MSSCPSAKTLWQYLSATLTSADRTETDVHLNACKACRTSLERLAATRPPSLVDYEIESVAAVGGMSIIYCGRRRTDGQRVAIKVLYPTALNDTSKRKRFFLEANVLAQLNHPGIVRIIGSGENPPHLILEWIEGATLRSLLTGRPVDARETASFLAKVTDAVAMFHKCEPPIVHRDLNPNNLMARGNADESLESLNPCVIDFGISKVVGSDDSLTGELDVLGTWLYLAPEQIPGDDSGISPATDVYALGVTLYEMLTGRPPFVSNFPPDVLHAIRHSDAIPPRRLVARIPRALETICLKCIDKNPKRRYPNAQELTEDLRRFSAGAPIAARPEPSLWRQWRWCKRNPATAILAAAVMLTLAIGLMTGGYLWRRAVVGEQEKDWHWRQAETARRDAEARHGQSLHLIAKLVEVGGTGMTPPMIRKARLAILSEAEANYLVLAERQDDSHAAERGLAELHRVKACFLHDGGQSRDAERAARDSIYLWERLLSDDPTNQELQTGLELTLNQLGYILSYCGRDTESLAALERAYALSQRAAVQDSELAHQLIAPAVELGSLLYRSRRPREALAVLQDSLSRIDALDSRRADRDFSTRLRNTRASILLALGDISSELPNAGRRYYELAYTNLTALLAERANDAALWHHLARCCWALSGGDPSSTYYKPALDAAEKAVAGYIVEVQNDGSHAISRLTLSLCYDLLGRNYLIGGQHEKAAGTFQKARELRQAITGDFTDVKPIVKLAQQDLFLAHTLRAAGALTEALQRTATAIADLEKAKSLDTSDVAILTTLNSAHYERGKVLWSLGRRGEAVDEFRMAVIAQRQAMTLRPDDPDQRRQLWDRYRRLAGWIMQCGQNLNEAETCLSEAEKLQPHDPDALREIAEYFRKMARIDSDGVAQGRFLQHADRLERAAQLTEATMRSRAN